MPGGSVADGDPKLSSVRLLPGDRMLNTKGNTIICRRVISPKLRRRLLRHRGKWVAFDGKRILGVADSPDGAVADARDQGVRSPTLQYVPRAEE